VKPQRILFLLEFGTLNGGENSLLAVAPRLAEQGFELVFAAPPATPFHDQLTRLGFPLEGFQVRSASGRETIAEIGKRIRGLVNRTRPQIVHANSLSCSRWLGEVAQQLPAKTIGHVRDIIRLSRPAQRALLQLDCVVAVSRAVENWMAQQGVRRPPTRGTRRRMPWLRTIYNGIALDDFRPGQPSPTRLRELGISSDMDILLSVGQIGMRKGLDLTLTSFIEMAKQEPQLVWCLVGERTSSKTEAVQYERDLHNRVRHAGLAHRVFFLGRRSDTATIMRTATLLVHAARQEPLGRVLLEAGATALPIVATGVGGTSEIFRSGHEALLVPPDSASQLGSAIRKLLGNPALAAALGQQACERIRTGFSVDSCAKQIAGLYDGLCGS